MHASFKIGESVIMASERMRQRRQIQWLLTIARAARRRIGQERASPH